MSQIIDANGALATAPAASIAPWETIYSEKGTLNRYNPPSASVLPEWRYSDYDHIRIDWFFANNGVRLYAPGGYTKIAGTLLSMGTGNTTNHWVHSIPNSTYNIASLASGQMSVNVRGSNVHPYGGWVAGEIVLHRNKANPTYWRGFIKIDSTVAVYHGVITADATRLCPLFDVNGANYMSLNILGRTS